MLHHLLQGLTSLGNGPSIGYLVLGSLMGVFIGVVPGLGGPVVLAMALAFLYHISLIGTLCFFLGTHAGSYFSASISSIFLNVPAHAEAYPVSFDGFPMAQSGQAGRALGISATATCVGGFVGCALFVALIPTINWLPNYFHPPEYVVLVLMALLFVGTLGGISISKSMISAGMGFMIASIGTTAISGTNRYTFGAVGLYSGIALVSVALGSFAIPQMVLLFGNASAVARQDLLGREIKAQAPAELLGSTPRQVISGILVAFRYWRILVQSAIIGFITGIVPGIGGFAANFMTYGIAQQTSRRDRRALFGTGIPEGIVAPEGSSLSKEAGGLIPTVGFGIAGGVGTALFLAALSIKGVRVGYGFATSYPVVPYQMAWIIALSGLIGTAAGLLAAPQLVRLTRIRGPVLMPFIMGLAAIGSFVATPQFFDVMEILLFSFVGFALRRLRYSLAAFLVGVVLAPTFENNVYLTRNLYSGVDFLWKTPLVDVLIALLLLVLFARANAIRGVNKEQRAARDAALAIEDPVERAAEIERLRREAAPYPNLAVLLTLALLAVSIFWIVYGVSRFHFIDAVMPVTGGFLVAVPSLLLLPKQLYTCYLAHQRRGAGEVPPAVGPAAVPVPAAVVPERLVESVREAELVSVGAAASAGGGGDDDATAEQASLAAPAAPAPFPSIVPNAWGRYGQFTREACAFVWFCALVGLCYLLGFEVGVPLFGVLYGLTSTRRIFTSWWRRVVFAAVYVVIMGAATYALVHSLHLTDVPPLNF